MTSSPPPWTLPPSCSVAFKEWAGIVNALADGRQTILLRKGGIDETDGPGRFRAEHHAFWLYPTVVHQAQQGLRVAPVEPPAEGSDTVSLTAFAQVVELARLNDVEGLPDLEPFHVWTEETVRKRFHYRQPGLWVLTVRVFRRAEPIHWPVTADQAGCKTWVNLEGDPPGLGGLVPARDETEFTRDRDQIRAILAGRGVGA